MEDLRNPNITEYNGVKIEKLDHKEKVQRKRRAGRKVKELYSELVFNSVTEAAEHFNLSSRNSIYQAVRLYGGEIKNKKLVFVFVYI